MSTEKVYMSTYDGVYGYSNIHTWIRKEVCMSTDLFFT
jgi:hypothetical protein